MDKLQNSAYRVITVSIMLWCFLIFIPPIIAYFEEPSKSVSSYAYRCFSTICHQHESRSLIIFGHKLAVCGRCSGIYFGALLGALLYPFFKSGRNLPARLLWIIITLPMAIDVFLNTFGMFTSSNLIRILTGAFFGVGSISIILPSAIEAVSKLLSQLYHHKGVTNESKT